MFSSLAALVVVVLAGSALASSSPLRQSKESQLETLLERAVEKQQALLEARMDNNWKLDSQQAAVQRTAISEVAPSLRMQVSMCTCRYGPGTAGTAPGPVITTSNHAASEDVPDDAEEPKELKLLLALVQGTAQTQQLKTV